MTMEDDRSSESEKSKMSMTARGVTTTMEFDVSMVTESASELSLDFADSPCDRFRLLGFSDGSRFFSKLGR
jgi:hypothetical protein